MGRIAYFSLIRQRFVVFAVGSTSGGGVCGVHAQ